MKRLSAISLAVIAAVSLAVPAFARDFVQDDAHLFSAATVSSLNEKISDFNRTTGKEIVVVTVPSLDGKDPKDVVERTFAQKQVNGVLFFFAKAEKKDYVLGDRASRAFFPAGSFDDIHQAMRGYLRSSDPDSAIKTGVNLALNQYRSHERALGGAAHPVNATRPLAPASSSQQSFGGFNLLWIILALIVGFLVIRAIFRAIFAPRVMPPMGMGGQPMGGPGYGPGYGAPGYGGGGGGGFFSGLLGGLGGAWLGNEMFGRHDQGMVQGTSAGVVGGADQQDAAGWQSDAGQADTSSIGGGDWGGGGDSGGGGFDGGGGGGGDGW